ncbi:hypothetical protein A2996_00680 [Candidatus Campbellbacteria bacterium RIFCSPLOWO2_01_FULL_34_15]|uniref:Uncharacterized protein n=2 Tax=Candidatus Campbelliibacteriota TaxID=1752727 RepID=A0A1F5ENA2_9BACT|nr:MAG: hypothetical protein A2996_00680 [Candidatus Campbellbacteria bacterium RIFCSPLOWO2_01_FULL_34_15]
MKKIIISASTIVAAAAIIIGATGAFFSDTETSTGNTFTAGAIDLRIDSTATYNGEDVEAATWTEKDLIPTSDKFFNFADIKPGDSGENTISLHVINNDAWVCAEVSNLTDLENGQTEPEASVDLTTGVNDGELSSVMVWNVWRDNGAGGGVAGDNIQNGSEQTLTSGNPADGVLSIYDSTTATGPLTGASTTYIGVSWSVPASVGNEIQTDSMTGDISFYVEQARNNDEFVCGSINNEEPERTVLKLENKDIDGTWDPYLNDGVEGELTFISSHPTFNYTLDVSGLVASTQYSIIYYADGWPGNNPGALIGTLTTDGSGDASVSGDVNLGMNLPDSADANYPGGAKIWVIKSSEYNSGTNSVTTWPVGIESLFESNLITYIDSDL